MTRTPILFLTDSPDLPSGLARIGRDLATRLAASPEFEVGYLGRGGIGGQFPFTTWTIPHSFINSGGAAEWGSSVLPSIWQSFAGDRRGAIFTIWDAPRMLWLSRPEYIIDDGPAKDFYRGRPEFSLWGYFPVDGHNLHGTLGRFAAESLAGYDRILAYGSYGAEAIGKTLAQHPGFTGSTEIASLPHGIDDAVWRSRGRAESRAELGWSDDDFLVGVVATNQRRKDWGLAAQVGVQLHSHFGDRYRQWWHVDREEDFRAWSIPSLLDEFALGPQTLVSTKQSDDWLATAYSACDVTLAIGQGEGFGYPIVESQACGTPCIHVDYAGGAGLVPFSNRIPWTRAQLDGPTNIQRPVTTPMFWSDRILAGDLRLADLTDLRWPTLWPRWQRWFEIGRREIE